MLGVYERGEGGLSSVVPLPGRLLATCVLRRSDDFKILIFEFRVNVLPAWQIEAAASPRSPGENQHLPAAKIGEMHGLACAIGNGEIGRDP